MFTKRLQPTLADYAAVALGPLLIMLLVGSLAFFLVEACYRGAYSTRLHWILFWYAIAIVLVARIAITEGRERAALFGMALAGATGLVVAKFVDQAFLAWGLLALIWWCANKLTWDCTFIDEGLEASGEGLLQRVGLEQPLLESSPQPGSDSQSAPATWKDRLPVWLGGSGKKRPHVPGVWVVYFSLAALPLFGLGQALIPASDVAGRRRALWLLVIYVAAGLGLLLTTSFLGLRRYLRQRRLEMPPALTAVWLSLGSAIALGLIVAALVLPRPQPEYPLAEMLGLPTQQQLAASQRAVLRDSPGQGEGAPGGSAQQQQAQQQPGGSQQGGQQPGGQQSGGQQSGGSQSGGSQSGGSQSGGSQSGGQSQSSGQSPGGSQQSGSQQSGSQPSGGQSNPQQQSGGQQGSARESGSNQDSSQQGSAQQSGSQQEDSQQGGSQQSGSQQSGSQPSGGQSNPQQQSGGQQGGAQQNGSNPDSSQQGSAQQSGSQQSGSQAESNPNGQSQQAGSQSPAQQGSAGGQQSGDTQPAENPSEGVQSQPTQQSAGEQQSGGASRPSQPPASASPPSAPQRPPLSLPQLGGWALVLGKFVAYVVLAAIVGYVLWKNGPAVLKALRELFRDLLGLWSRLTGRRAAADAADELEAAARAPRRRFVDYADPFLSGAARRSSTKAVLVYTYTALEVWASEQGRPRRPDETPLEFAAALGEYAPQLGTSVDQVTQLYVNATYGRADVDRAQLGPVEQLWRRLAAARRAAPVEAE